MRFPELRIVTRANEEVSSDALEVHKFDECNASDYRLDHLATESLFYIVSPRDIVVAKPRDLDDHIRWLVDRQKYEEALAAAEAYPTNIAFISLCFIALIYYLAQYFN
jgi:hypothetical protein